MNPLARVAKQSKQFIARSVFKTNYSEYRLEWTIKIKPPGQTRECNNVKKTYGAAVTWVKASGYHSGKRDKI